MGNHQTDLAHSPRATQVKSNMVALAKSKYGHHVVRKLINVSTKEQVPGQFLMLLAMIIWALGMCVFAKLAVRITHHCRISAMLQLVASATELCS